jgi:hypothetical protein
MKTTWRPGGEARVRVIGLSGAYVEARGAAAAPGGAPAGPVAIWRSLRSAATVLVLPTRPPPHQIGSPHGEQGDLERESRMG